MRKSTIPKSAKVIVIGGGVAGCSAAYHLAKFGWKDTILLERDQLTSGTTWHAAGLVSQLGPSAAITKIRKYSLELYKKLERELDFSSGLKLNGALSIATTEGRWQETYINEYKQDGGKKGIKLMPLYHLIPTKIIPENKTMWDSSFKIISNKK